MYDKILVALDGSNVSERILPHAQMFSVVLRLPVELVTVIDPESLKGLVGDNDADFRSLLNVRQTNADLYLKSIAPVFKGGARVECTVAVGEPDDVIVDRAAKDAETLIAIGTHGRSGIDRWMLGSVADKVLHVARNPLLLVRTTDGSKMPATVALKSIIVPLDGSELAESVLPHAEALSKKMNLEVILLRTFNIPNAYYYTETYTIDERIWEMLEKEAEDYLAEKVKLLKSAGVANVRSAAVQGFAAEKIIDFGRQTPASLIAMCTHGRSGVRRFLLGSVADRVVRHSGDPVLLIRAPAAASAP
jgi:nucleotide-binding universal stress UspA family protein